MKLKPESKNLRTSIPRPKMSEYLSLGYNIFQTDPLNLTQNVRKTVFNLTPNAQDVIDGVQSTSGSSGSLTSESSLLKTVNEYQKETEKTAAVGLSVPGIFSFLQVNLFQVLWKKKMKKSLLQAI